MASVIDEAAAAFQNSRLYVDPAAEPDLGNFDPTAAEQTLDGASTPVYVAIVPTSADGSVTASDVASAANSNGTYVLMLPNGRFDVTSNSLSGADQAVEAAASESGDMSQFIPNLVSNLDELAAGNDSGSGSDGGNSGGGGGGLLPLAILAAAGGGGFLLYRRNKRSKERAQLEQVRGALDEDITKYGERLSELDLDISTDSKVPIEARHEYGRALDLYENAKTFADRAERPTDLRPVTTALEEGRWLLACVDARTKGEPIPERRLPCFFDPGHGPSVEDIEWAPSGGAPRTVPACAADALRIKNGADPETRMVPVGDGERRPYYDAGPAYGGWAGGYFGGLLPGMLIGTMLGSAMSSPVYVDGGGGDGGGGDSGGFEGGGWGDSGGFGGGGWGDGGGGFDGGGFGGD